MTGPNAEPQPELLTPQQKLNWCLTNLGDRITCAGVGVSDARRVGAWPVIGLPAEAQPAVDLLYETAKQIADAYGEEGEKTAIAFLRGTNPYLDNVSPVEVIASTGWVDNPEQARESVRVAVSLLVD